MKTESTNAPHLVYSSRTPGRVRDRWPKQLSLLRMSMNALGVRMMRLEYDGREGEGDFLAPRLMDNEFQEVAATLKEQFVQQVETFFRSLLESRYGGWAAGQGACGDFGIDFKFGTVVHVHRYRYRVTEYDTTRLEGFSAACSDES